MSALDIRKIYASPALQAEYNELLTEIRSLDSGVPVPPPVHVSALAYMRGLLVSLRKDAA
jgi:hypothetical protein